MKNRKNTILTIAVAGLVAIHVQVFAGDTEPPEKAARVEFDVAELNLLFDSGEQPIKLSALQDQEMKDTQGAWVPIVVGGFAGGLFNGINYYNTPNHTVGGWTTAIGSGVVGGAVGGIGWWSAPIWGGGIAATGGWAASNLR